jgi:hypothetical protein
MKKGDVVIVLVSLVLMLSIFVGYQIYQKQFEGMDRLVEIRAYNESSKQNEVIYEIKLDSNVNTEVLFVEGQDIKIIDKNKDPQASFDLEGIEHYNIIKIFNNGIEVIEADCDNQDDVRKGFTNRLFDIIICLPHRLEVEITASEPIDDGLDGIVE